ncbi:hypothetical protein C8N24_4496 [Solirubrobacter pauli]|uniref:Uncharacterized protein n=1 Tax=Solirubrobacter pauli TaxID=166793 RepID=A0A660KZV2_9ACTN|nr:hypothetical protein C8N24_4496 [Solirubrobacter pauli]
MPSCEEGELEPTEPSQPPPESLSESDELDELDELDDDASLSLSLSEDDEELLELLELLDELDSCDEGELEPMPPSQPPGSARVVAGNAVPALRAAASSAATMRHRRCCSRNNCNWNLPTVGAAAPLRAASNPKVPRQTIPALIICSQISDWSTTATPSFSALAIFAAPTSAPVISMSVLAETEEAVVAPARSQRR